MNTSLGRFILEPIQIYHPLSGVTNNMSESFNATLKRLQGPRDTSETIVESSCRVTCGMCLVLVFHL